jgi:hypothetical protein
LYTRQLEKWHAFIMSFVKATRIVCTLVGLFEFISAVSFFFDGEYKVQSTEKLVPSVIGTDPNVKVLYCVYLITLGVQRLSWSSGNGGLIAWILLLLTHISEFWMWFTFATRSEFRGDSTLQELLLDIVTLKSYGGRHACIITVCLPTLILLFLLAGPNQFSTTLSGKKKV